MVVIYPYSKRNPSTFATGGAAFSGNLSDLNINVAKDWGTYQIKNVADPTLAQDVATKNYVDSLPSGSSIVLFGGGTGEDQIATNNARYLPIQGMVDNINIVDTWKANILMARAGTLKYFYVFSDIAIAGAAERIFTVMRNEVATSIVATLTGGAQNANDLVNTQACSAADRIAVRSTGSGSPAAARCCWGIAYELS